MSYIRKGENVHRTYQIRSKDFWTVHMNYSGEIHIAHVYAFTEPIAKVLAIRQLVRKLGLNNGSLIAYFKQGDRIKAIKEEK